LQPIDALYAALAADRGVICRTPSPDLLYGKLAYLRKHHREFENLSLVQRGDLIYIKKVEDAPEN
jgi:hypothetical protein